jgi:glycosyltransferase involved in cell wall biosynthesis
LNILTHWKYGKLSLRNPDRPKYISDRNKRKVFVAYNTLCFDDIDKETIQDKNEVKRKYSIQEDKVILYISRVLPYKRLDILLENFSDEKDVALVIVGSGINDQQLILINKTPNYYYLGPRYGRDVDEIFNMGDVYSTPGHIGLGIIQAFFWGKPVVVLNARHAPEIYYMKDGENGYIIDDEKELKERILFLLRTESVYNRLSSNAIKTVNKEAHINRMFNGFISAVSYCVSKGAK